MTIAPFTPEPLTGSGGALAEAEVLLERAGLSAEFTAPAVTRSARRAALPAMVAADGLALAAALFAGRLVDIAVQGHGSVAEGAQSIAYVTLYLAVLAAYGLYRTGRRRLVPSSFPDFSRLAHAVLVASLGVELASGPLHRWSGWASESRTSITAAAAMALVAVPSARAVARWLVTRHSGTASRVLIVGSGVVADGVVRRLASADTIRLVGVVDDSERAGTVGDVPLLGGLDIIPELVARGEVDHLVVAFSPVSGAKLAAMLRVLASQVQISVVPRLFDLLTVRSQVDDLFGLPVVDVAPASLGPGARLAKRCLDIVGAAVGLAVLSPLLAVIAVAVKLDSSGPVIYSQERSGRRGRTFRIHKFRTMHDGAHAQRAEVGNDVDGPLFKSREDPRITRVGRVLRTTSLDELPQLFDVLMGTMSLVGPRPFVTSESDQIDGWAARRFDVRPGITGLWQVSGRSDLPFDELCRLDYSYVASWSFWWDMRILWHTPAMVLRRRGAY